ncbi:hypothetical protein EJP67_33155 [Variovorax guangxiensis]|uniref:Uncharacterized protein n=1 Tax=Variovorax guangxiensis TaxID=1775474 RepID=A0A433MVI5_9BURK|nr:hypothetical protein [Variovorax guangxiensis]RUR71907.1 hypothetical protein EJP67_33155 [Variovorax guangxiensis]
MEKRLTVQKATPVQCAPQEILVPKVRGSVVKEAVVRQHDGGTFTLTIRLARQEPVTLASRRTPDEPRHFKHAETALRTGRELFGIQEFVVLLR